MSKKKIPPVRKSATEEEQFAWTPERKKAAVPKHIRKLDKDKKSNAF